MWSFSPSKAGLGLPIPQVSIVLIYLQIPAAWPLFSRNFAISWIPIPAGSGIACIWMSPVVEWSEAGRVMPFTDNVCRRCVFSAAHTGKVEIESAGEFFHPLFHGGGGAFIGRLQCSQSCRFTGLLAFREQRRV